MSLIAPSGSLTSASAAAAVATAQTPGPSVVLATPLPQQPISTPAVAGNLALTPATLIQPGPAPGPSVVANPPPTSASPAPQQSTSSGTGSRSNGKGVHARIVHLTVSSESWYNIAYCQNGSSAMPSACAIFGNMYTQLRRYAPGAQLYAYTPILLQFACSWERCLPLH